MKATDAWEKRGRPFHHDCTRPRRQIDIKTLATGAPSTHDRTRSPAAASAARLTAAPSARDHRRHPPLAAATEQQYHPPWRVLSGDVNITEDTPLPLLSTKFGHSLWRWPEPVLPAAFRWNTALIALYARLAGRGKPHKAALIACTRTGQEDTVEVLWWRRGRWATFGDLGGVILLLDQALDYIANEPLFW